MVLPSIIGVPARYFEEAVVVLLTCCLYLFCFGGFTKANRTTACFGGVFDVDPQWVKPGCLGPLKFASLLFVGQEGVFRK